MEGILGKKSMWQWLKKKDIHESKNRKKQKNLSNVDLNVTYTIKAIDTEDVSMRDFLFTLGCYEGEAVTVISKLADNYIISVKDARYSIDSDLAKVVVL